MFYVENNCIQLDVMKIQVSIIRYYMKAKNNNDLFSFNDKYLQLTNLILCLFVVTIDYNIFGFD